MLNFVATGLIAYLISTDAFGSAAGNNISTPADPPSGRVPGNCRRSAATGTLFG